MQAAEISQPNVDFLAIGHVCRDLVGKDLLVGGAAAYASMTIKALGLRPAIVTSSAADENWADDLPDIPMHILESPVTTLFENIYHPQGRTQIIHAIAKRLAKNCVPAAWTGAPLVFVGPIANEVDPDVIDLFDGKIIGIGPQGWMRRWDDGGRVYTVDWREASWVLPKTTVTFLSVEDLRDPSLINRYIALANILVITDGAHGCKVYHGGESRVFGAPKVNGIDTTGAGDIFAAAFMFRFHMNGGDCWDSAMFGNQIASSSVGYLGMESKMAGIRSIANKVFQGQVG